MRFENFSAKYDKTYTPTEKIYRQYVYEQNMRENEAHNADPTSTDIFGETKFTDLT